MDERDLVLWSRQATAEKLERRILDMDNHRVAMSEGFQQVVDEICNEVNRLRLGIPYEEQVKESWDELRAMGGR